MNRSVHTGLMTIVCISLPAVCALADEPSVGVPEQAQELQCLAGTWEGTGTATIGGQTASVQARLVCEPTAGGWGVLCRSTFSGVPGLDSYDETDLFGYDPGDGLYHWFSVTNAGETHDHRGGMIDANTLVFEHTGPMQGQVFSERIVMRINDDWTMEVEAVTTLGNRTEAQFQLRLAKQNA